MIKGRILAFIGVVALFSPHVTWAEQVEVKGLDPLPPGDLYRYENTEGTTVFSRMLTMDGVNNGYLVLDRYGRILLSVKGRLADDEAEKQSKTTKKKEKVKQITEEQARIDRDILRLYSSAAAAENAMERQLSSVRASLEYSLISLDKTKKNRDQEKQRFQDYEKRGEPIPESIVNALNIYESRVVSLTEELSGYERAMAEIRTKFTPMIERLIEIEAEKAKQAEE
ncbi:MAG TPA: hypothetical protein VK099_03370 [Alcanivoracaceae bacterium]|nr:hypothetical protein [Alcanivoracaceae bacterium]